MFSQKEVEEEEEEEKGAFPAQRPSGLPATTILLHASLPSTFSRLVVVCGEVEEEEEEEEVLPSPIPTHGSLQQERERERRSRE